MEADMVINNAADFGKSLKKRRKELGYTQRYISEFTGFSISFISDLENGKSTAELGKAIYLANMLGLDIAVNARGNK
jgi:transcriptional regulator with XRE-family HTH domain